MSRRLRMTEIGDYLLALLPLLVTLLFLLFRLTAWSAECPVGEPCLGAADFSSLANVGEPVEPRIAPQRSKGRIDPKPAGRDEEGHLEQRFQRLDGLSPPAGHGVDPRQVQLAVAPGVFIQSRALLRERLLGRRDRLVIPAEVRQRKAEQRKVLTVARAPADHPLETGPGGIGVLTGPSGVAFQCPGLGQR